MKELSLREIQLAEFGVLKKLAELCRKLNLRYYLFFGTLLGAVRHQGFIPWDDDIDVAMPRPDYEKLLAYCAGHEKEIAPLKLMHYTTHRDYIYPIARLCDTRYHVDYEGVVEYGLGLFVDIYPLDGCGETEADTHKLAKKNQMLANLVFQAGMKKFVRSGQAGWRTPVKFLLYCVAKVFGPRFFANKLEQSAKRYPYETSDRVNCTIWDVVDYGFDRSLFDTAQQMPFEDAELSVPAGYEQILRKSYGDYMQLPPEEDRVGHHYYTAYLKDGYSVE